MSFPFALWLPEKTSEPVPCAIQISCHDPVVHDQMKGIDPAMREKFMGMMKELVGNEDHFNVMMIDMMAPKEPNTLDITCDVEKGYWPVRQLLADGYATAAIYASSLAPDEGDSWKQEGLYPLFYEAGERPADGFGCLTAWGFGAQRVLDALPARRSTLSVFPWRATPVRERLLFGPLCRTSVLLRCWLTTPVAVVLP